MPIDNTEIMKQRSKNFKQYESYIKSFNSFLNNFPIFSIPRFAKSAYKTFSNLPSWSKPIVGTIVGVFIGLPAALIGITTIVAAEAIKFSLACLTRPFGIKTFSFRPMTWSLYKVAQNASTPEMQKLLLEKTNLLEKIGQNKETVKGILNDLILTDQTTKQLANATLDLLGDEDFREKLKTELVNNYFKFNLHSFDREGFITNFTKYEKSQITDKIKDELGLIKLLQAKSDIRLGDSNYNLKKILKTLGESPSKQEISNTLKTQLTKELQILGLSTDSINTLLPDRLKLSLKGAQEILQNQYKLVLDKKINEVSQRIGDEIRQKGSIDNFDHYIEDILTEHAAYVVDVQEPLYQQNFVDDYIKFHQDKGSTKPVNELREEAIEISYGLAPDYMRLTQNVLRVVDSLPDQDHNIIETGSPNLKTLLTKQPTQVITFAKSIIGDSGPLRDMLDGFGVTDEVLDLAPLVLSKDDGIAKVANLTESIRSKFIFDWTEDILNFLNSNPELQQKFIDKPEMASNLTKGIVNSIPFLKNLCQDLGATNPVLDIILILVKTPEDTQKLLEHLNRGEYIELTQKFIEIASSNEELRNYLTTNKEVYKNLITSLFKEIDLIRNIQTNNGITDAELGEILDSGLGVLDNPAKFTELMEVTKQIFDIANQYMTENNINKFADLTKNDYIKLTKLILQNDRLLTLLENNKEEVGKFAKLLTEKIPALRAMKTQYLGEVAVDTFVTNLIESGILRNKDNISVMLDRYSGNVYKAVDIFSYIYRGSSTLKNLLSIAPISEYFSSASINQTLSDSIKNIINSNTTKNSLTELLTSSNDTTIQNLGATKKLDGIELDEIDFAKAKKIHGFSFTSSQLSIANFQRTEIKSTSFANSMFKYGVNFEDANLQDVDFSNSAFSTYNLEKLYLPARYNAKGITRPEYIISFKNSTLTNVNFSDIDLVKKYGVRDEIKIDFEGATIDPSTFYSLIAAIRKNPELKDKINLVGAKIIGDLSERDLSNLDLEGIDLSGIASLQGTIIKNTNLKGTNINPELLKKTMQLESIETDFTLAKLNEIEEAQQENRKSIITKKISKIIVNKLINDGKLVVKDYIQINLFIEKLNTKLSTEINSLEESEKQFLYGLFEENYANLDQFAINPNTVKHYSDLTQNPLAILNILYTSAFTDNELSDLNLAKAIKYENMKNLIADEVGKELFGEGQNRGKDFLIIRDHIASVFDRLSDEEKENLYAQICTIDDSIKLNQSEECKLLIQSLKSQYYDITKYTTAGKVVTSGIYIPTTGSLNEFVQSDANKMKSISDLEKISDLSNAVGQKLGEKLFGPDMSSSRKKDTQKIINYLNNHVFPSVLCSLSEDERAVFLDKTTNHLEEFAEVLVGKFNKTTTLGYKTVDLNSLSQLFYNASSHTMVGSVSVGLQLNSTTLSTQEFFDSVTECIKSKCNTQSVKIENLAQQIGTKLGEKLFGPDMSTSREHDTQKIINTLRDSVIPELSETEKTKLSSSQNLDTLIGNYKQTSILGYWSSGTRPESLSQLFYDNSSSTKMGYATGGIKIDDTILTSRAFLDKVKTHMRTSLANGRQI